MSKVFPSLVLALVLIAPALVSAAFRHSGTVVSVDRARGTVTIEELTASNGEMPRAVRRTVTVAPDARVSLQIPTPDGYKSLPMSVADLRSGDFVTVVGTDDGAAVQASTVDVVREASASAQPR
jgi:hypothetical protein